jgi:hypothetical protein
VIDTPLHAHEPPPGYLRTADLLAALSLASDLAVGLPAEHAVRSCYIAMHVAERLQLPAEQRIDLYYAMLLMDAGCTAWTSQLAGLIVSDEIAARRDFVFHRNARDPVAVFGWLKHHVASGGPYLAAFDTDSSSLCRAANSCAKASVIRARSHSALPSDWACRRQSRTR